MQSYELLHNYELEKNTFSGIKNLRKFNSAPKIRKGKFTRFLNMF